MSYWWQSALVLGLLTGAGALFLAALSRHKKSGSKSLRVKDVPGRVHETLQPTGSVLLDGELWPARSRRDKSISSGTPIRVIGTTGAYLLVETESDSEN